MQLINIIKNITRPYSSSMFSCSSFPSCSCFLCFSFPSAISRALGPGLLPVFLAYCLPCVAHQQCTISTRRFAGHRSGLDWGDITMMYRVMCCRALLWWKPTSLPIQAMGSPVQAENSPALPVSFIWSLPKGRSAQQQYLNLEALWGIGKQCDFSASCITIRKGHSLPLMTFYVHKAMPKEL